MANNLLLPILSPIKYCKPTPDFFPQYMSRHMDDYHFEDTLLPWEQDVVYLQPFQTSDSVRQQLRANYGPFVQKVIDEDGQVFLTEGWQQMQQDLSKPDWYIYQSDIDLSPLSEGVYRFVLECGVTGDGAALTLISNRFEILQSHAQSVLLEYTNYRFREGVIFETGYSPSLRVQGVLRYAAPATKRTVYEDQNLSTVTLDSKKYRLWNLHLGGATGLPDYMIDKLESILGCSEVLIDGRPYAAAEGAKFEANEEENYPMRGYTIELREKYNSGEVEWQNEELLSGMRVAVINVDSKGFIEGDQGGSSYQILDIN